jgi:hypothetical protein
MRVLFASVEHRILDYAPSLPPRQTPWTRRKVTVIVMTTIDVMLVLVFVPKLFNGVNFQPDVITEWFFSLWLTGWLLVLPFLVAFLLRNRDGRPWRELVLSLALSPLSWPAIVFAYFVWIVPARRRRNRPAVL